MSDEKVTPLEIAEWLKSRNYKAAWLAKTLQVTPATVSRWINGKVAVSGSDEALLKLLIRGEMPFEIANEKTLHGVLDFSEDQWRIIVILSKRKGISPGTWIADRIREYLTIF